MGKALITESTLTDTANAIRSKLGVQTQYKPGQMASAILSIPTYPEPTGTVAITTNGSHDVKDFETANVNVPGSHLVFGIITENGTFSPDNADGYFSVDVDVTPNLQDKTVTANGTVTPDSGYDGLGQVVVNVQGGGGVQSGYTPPSNASGADGDLYAQIAKDGILRSDGQCYIDTLIFPRATYWALVDFCMNVTTSNYDTVYGTRNGGVGRFTARFDASNNGSLVLHMSPSPSLGYNAITLPLTKNSVVNIFANVTYKAQKDDANNNDFPYTLYLFANNNAGSPSDYAAISVKRFCLFDENDVCILYMVPAKDQNDVACMYDLISGNYYYNSGASTSHYFTYTDLESEKLAVIWQKTNGAWVPVATN